LAAGPLLAAIQGAVAGAAAGLEVGALAGLGFWTDEAHIHADGLKKGGLVVAIPAQHEHAEHARKIFADCGADAVRG
jgi:predicted O-methyltransferase YrrM